MPGNIFARKQALHEIFKDERFLYPEYVPERLPHRDAEIDSIAFAIKPIASGKKPQNIFVYGKSGTGKTVTVKFVLNELQEYTDRAKSLYLNCFQFNSRHSILAEISNFLQQPIPRRGLGTDEVYERVLAGLKRADFTPIIVLDEADQLLLENEASKIFYDLLRATELSKGKRFGLVFISNSADFIAKLDSRVKSSLAADSILFESYSPQQLKDILNERARYALHENAFEKDVVNFAAAHAAKLGGDARIAIECLLQAGRLAEKENAEKMGVKHLQHVFSSVDSAPVQKLVSALSEQEKIVLLLLPASGSLTTGELYKKFLEKSGQQLTLRRFRDFISKLQGMRLINVEFTSKEAKGRTRNISLAVSRESIFKALC